MSDIMQRIFDENGVIKQIKNDYVPRQSQIEAANLIDKSLEDKGHCIIEGPCGMGKSFAYLIPLVDYIIRTKHNHKAIIATSGISLQEQILYKDLPLISEIFSKIYEDRINFTLMKGKQNFICKRKMKDIIADDVYKNTKNPELRKIINWSFDTKTGDFSELDFVPGYEISKEISCTKNGECLGKKCDHCYDCYYQRLKEKCQSADIVVTNYHILFSDIETGGKILPNYDVLICDEAHEIGDIYRDFKTRKISPNVIKSIRNDIVEIRNKFSFKREFIDSLDLRGLVYEAEKYFNLIYKKYFDVKFPDFKIIEPDIELPDKSDLLCKIQSFIDKIGEEVDTLQNIVLAAGEGEEANELSICLNKMSSVLDRLCEVYTILNEFIDKADSNLIVYWLEKEDDDSSSLNMKPVKIGEELSNELFSQETLACILTSATLSVNDKFDYIKSELGLDVCGKNVNEFVGESPFNLTDQQLWYLPEDAVEGNNPGFDSALNGQLLQIVKACNGGVLALFTSVRNLNSVYDYLKWEIPYHINIFKQGSKPKIQLLEDFKSDVNSVLLATRSFFTGVDIPGDSLRCVVVDKLPFPSPGDPVMRKLQKEDNSFFKYFIPMMIITLKQAVGRGVRSIDDKCVICILDNRMATARYKSKINGSFNYNKTGTRNIEDVRKFCGVKDDDEEDGLNSIDDGSDIPF
jgi:ATP-dependent DNA helicase DinG